MCLLMMVTTKSNHMLPLCGQTEMLHLSNIYCDIIVFPLTEIKWLLTTYREKNIRNIYVSLLFLLEKSVIEISLIMIKQAQISVISD